MSKLKDTNSVWSYLQARTYVRGLHLVRNRNIRLFVNYLGFLVPQLDWLSFVRIFEDPLGLIMDDWNYHEHLGTSRMCPACKKGATGHYNYIGWAIEEASKHLLRFTGYSDYEWNDLPLDLTAASSVRDAYDEDGFLREEPVWCQEPEIVGTEGGGELDQPGDIFCDELPPRVMPREEEQVWEEDTGPFLDPDVVVKDGIAMTSDIAQEIREPTSIPVDFGSPETRTAVSSSEYASGYDPRDCNLEPGKPANTTDIRYVNPRTGLVWLPGEREAFEKATESVLQQELVQTGPLEVAPPHVPLTLDEQVRLALNAGATEVEDVDYSMYFRHAGRKELVLPPPPIYQCLSQDNTGQENFRIDRENRRAEQRWMEECERILNVVPSFGIVGTKLYHYVKPVITKTYQPTVEQDYDELGLRIVKKPIKWEDALELLREGKYNPDEWNIITHQGSKIDRAWNPLEEDDDDESPEVQEYEEYMRQRAEILEQQRCEELRHEREWSECQQQQVLEWEGEGGEEVNTEILVKAEKKTKKSRHRQRKPRREKDLVPDIGKLKAAGEKNYNDKYFDDEDFPPLTADITETALSEESNDQCTGDQPHENDDDVPDLVCLEDDETQMEVVPLTSGAMVVEKDTTVFQRVLLDAREEDVSQLGEEPQISWGEYFADMKSAANLSVEAVAVPGMKGKLLPNPLVAIRTDQNYYPVTKVSMVPEVTLAARKILSWAHGVVADSKDLDVDLARGNMVWQNEWAKRFLHCPRFSFVAQYQNRCPYIHWHEESCLEDHQMRDMKCELHGWSHARDWLDYTLQIISLYHNMDPKVPRYYLLATFGVPVVIKMIHDSPPSLARRADWIRAYTAGGFARIGPYMGQGPGIVQSVFQPFSSFKTAVVNSLGDVKNAIRAAADYILDLIVRILKPVEMMKRYLVDLVRNVIDYVYAQLFDFIYEVGEWTTRHSHLVMTTIEVLVLLMLVALGLMEWKTAEIIVGATTASGVWCSVFQGQAPDNPLLSAMTLITGIYYFLRPMQVSEIRDRLAQLSLILTTAGVVTGSINLIYFLIPEGLRLALKYTFGGNTAVVTERVSAWRSRVIALNKLSGTNDVLISKEYYDLVKKSIGEGLGFLRDAPPSERNNVMTMIPPLMKLDHILWSYQEARRDRPLPFVLHLSGRPGVGKTLLVHTILTKLGYGPSDVYFRPVSSEFWDGYNGQKVIVYDEFLVGSEMAERIGTEFLQLASTAHFQVPSASVENPLVGIKGTYSHPEVVITICNHIYPVVMSIPDDALHRRRSMVVNFDFTKSAKKKGGNTVDLKAYAPEDYAKAPWVECRLYPPQPDGSSGKIASEKGIRFEEFLELLIQDYDQHAQVVKKLLSAHMISPDSMSPADILNKALAQMEGVPPGPVNIFTYVTSWMGRIGSHFLGQGPVVECKNGICTLSDSACEVDAVEQYLGSWMAPQCPVTYHEMVVSRVSHPSGWATVGKAATMTAAMIGIVLLARAIARRFGDANDTVTFISEGSGEPRRKKRRAKDKRYHWGTLDARSEGPFVQAELVFPHEMGSRRITVLPLKERYVCTYYHALLGLPRNKPTVSVQLLYAGRRYTANVVWANVRVDNDNDLVVIELENPQIPQFPSLINKLVSEDDFELITELPVMVSLLRSGSVVPVMTTAVKAENRSYVVDESMVTLDLALVYQADTQPGDCGSALMVRSGPYVGKIVGIHVAGKSDDMGPSHGMAVVLTREAILSALEHKQVSVPEDAGFVSQSVEVETLDSGQEIYLPRQTKLEPSCIAPYLNYPTKQPAILSPADKRNSAAKDPVDVFLERLCPNLPEADPEVLEEVRDSMIHYYARIKGVLPWKILSIEEAIMGLPGWLPALNLDSSVGIPLCYRYKHGKREIMDITAQELRMDPGFIDSVSSFVKSFIAGKEQAHWLGYLKDELVSENKIDAVRTRVVYCGDVVAMVAFRMFIGSLVANFHSACKIVPHAIGLNPYSYDMHVIQQYLSEVGNQYVAGDYKDYDNRQHPQFRDVAFQVLKSLALRIEGFSAKCWEMIARYHQSGFVQIGNKLVKQISGHFSGSFLTTIVNCLVNEAYIRYVFRVKCPGLNFDENIRMKCLGDDHIICVRSGVNFGFSVIQKGLADIGQIYTTDDKKTTGSEFKRFDEVTFLGARPVVYKGRWVGSLKPDIIQRMCMWTRDKDKSTYLLATIAIEYATLVPGDFYEVFKDQVLEALQKAGLPTPELRPRKVVATEIANRTTQSGLCFFGHGAQDLCYALKSFEWPMSAVLGEFKECLAVDRLFPRVCRRCELCKLARGQGRFCRKRRSDTYGTSGACFVPCQIDHPGTCTCSSVDLVRFHGVYQSQGPVRGPGAGTTLTKLDPPSDVAVARANTDSAEKAGASDHLSLEQCASSYIQRASAEWTTGQAPGTVIYKCSVPFGLLAQGTQDSVQNMPFERFTYWKGEVEVMVQINGNPFQQGLLYVYFYPLSMAGDSVPLVNWPSLLHATLQPGVMNSAVLRVPYRFPSPVMLIQRVSRETVQQYDLGMVCVGIMSQLRSVENENVNVTVYVRFPSSEFHNPRIRLPTSAFVAQGSSQSTVNNNYTYDIKDVAGTLGISSSNAETGQQITGSLGLEMPLDNPPLASGSVPTAPAFSGMARSMGLEPTVPLSLNPVEADRYHKGLFEPVEQTVSFLMSRPFLHSSCVWHMSNGAGDVMWKIDFDSCLSYPFDGNTQIGVPLGVLNMFHYWRADLHLRLKVVKTPYHTGRLRITTAYDMSAPNLESSTSYFNKVFDFTELDEGEMIIPYMAATEFRRTLDSERERLPNYRETYGIASVSLMIVNPLRLLSTAVSNAVDVLIYAWFENAVVSVPRSISSVKGMFHGTTIAATQRAFKAQGPFPQVKEDRPVPDRLNLGQKFEYRVANILDIARRMSPIDLQNTIDGTAYTTVKSLVTGVPPNACSIRVFPSTIAGIFYAGWCGTLRYRIFMPGATELFHQVTFIPLPLWSQGTRPWTTGDMAAIAFTPSTSVTSSTAPISAAGTSGAYGAIIGPHEMLAPLSNGKDWIDVSVPFRSTFSFLVMPSVTPSGSLTQSFTETYPGTLSFAYTANSFVYFKLLAV
uniref:Genome polyprotein n=1 Tax=Posavirus strain 9676 TaxID=1828551 RepID=A0A166HR04_9VIRU|nr:polyprotein [Posavirus strain 9676]